MALPDMAKSAKRNQTKPSDATGSCLAPQLAHLWYMVAQAVLPVAEGAELAHRQHGRLALDEAAHALGLHHRRDQRVEVVLGGGGGGDVAGARFGVLLSWRTVWSSRSS